MDDFFVPQEPLPPPPPRTAKSVNVAPCAEVPRCNRCNRKLKDRESIARGMGKLCYRKHQAYVEKFCISLFDAPPKKAKKKSA